MRIDSILINNDELILLERGSLKDALRQYHHLEIIQGRKLMQISFPKGFLIVFTAVWIYFLFVDFLLALKIFSLVVLGQMSLSAFFLYGFFAFVCITFTIDMPRSRRHNSWIGGWIVRLFFPFDRLLLRKKFNIGSLAGRCFRFTRAGYYILPLPDETAYEKALQTIQAKATLSVPRGNFSVKEHSSDRIMLVAFHHWHRLKLLDRPRSALLERTVPASDWARILAKMEDLGYFISK